MKKQLTSRILLFTLMLLAFAGCDSNDPDEPETITGTFELEVTGDVTQTISGLQAAFGAATDPQTGITGFGLSLGTTNGSTAQSLTIARKGGRPGRGNHAIAGFSLTSDPEDLSDDDIIAIFSTGTDVFYASGGTLNLTESSSTRLEGSINLTARSILPESTAEVSISGNFVAVGQDVSNN